MSFSSAQWTIPELCVWIATRNKVALNNLSPSVGRSLKNTNLVHPGAYAARDEVVEAAQSGAITVTCAGNRNHQNSNPERVALSVAFWKNAEIKDSTAGWMADFAPRLVAAPVDQPAKQYDDLLVESAKAKQIWPPSSNREDGSASPEGAAPLADPARSREHTPKATQAEHDDWYKVYVKRLQAEGR